MKFVSPQILSVMADYPSISTRNVLKHSYRAFGKRAVDIILCLLLLPVIVPVIIFLCVLTKRDGGGGLFGHKRVGQNGELFNCWKIRTMVMDAEQRLTDHLSASAEAAAEWEQNFKLDKDPRVTKLGKFLRRTSLDELPQIWNVLKGEMSFVGPRPVVPSELQRYGKDKRVYLSLTPGITGLWQVSGRNEVSYDERVSLDVRYWRSLSLWSDLVILIKTFGTVLNRTGK